MCDDCDHEEYIDKCTEILECDKMAWCHEFVDSVKEYAEQNGHISEKQADVIDRHMETMKDRHYY